MSYPIEVPSEIVRKWQGVVDLLAEIMHVPAALIMRAEPQNIKVFVASGSEGNPYERGEVAALDTGHYCETVMKTRRPLLVADALHDEIWKSGPNVKSGMISYLGVPIVWPDNEIFGTVCVLDNKKNEYSESYLKLMLQWRDVFQDHLRSLASTQKKVDLRDAKLRRFVDTSMIGIFVDDFEGRFIEANDAFLDMVGYEREELLSGHMKVADLTPPEWRDRTARTFADIRMGKAVPPYEKEYFRKDGSRVPVVVGAVSFDEEGKQGIAFVLDISKRKRAEEAARRSEKELRDVIETMPAMAWATLPNGSNNFVTQSWREFTGMSPKDASGGGWKASFHPADIAAHVAKWRASLVSGKPFESEARLRHAADGDFHWFLHRAIPLRGESGAILKWYGISTDIDDRKRAEALLAGEKRILEMVAKGDSLAEILESLCRLVEEQAYGVLASILLLDGNRLRHGGAPSLPKAYVDAIDGVLVGPSVGSCGTAAYRGEQVIVEDIATDPLWADYRAAALPHSLRACWSTPIFSSHAEVIATFAMYYREPRSPSPHDQETIEQITHLAGVAIERNRTQEALRRSEAYLAESQTLTHTGSWVYDPGVKKAIYWSEEMFRIFGLDPRRGNPPDNEEFIRMVHVDDRSKLLERGENSFQSNIDHAIDYRIVLPDGTVKHIHSISHPVLNDAGELIERIGNDVDVTESKRTEGERNRAAKALRDSEEQWRAVFENNPTMYFMVDAAGVILSVNPFGAEQLGFTVDDLTGSPVQRLFLAEDREAVAKNVAICFMWPGQTMSWEARKIRKNGDMLWVRETARVMSIKDRLVALIVCEDITERKRVTEVLRAMQTELAHANRLATMGQLTASIAHEVNQPLAGTVSNAEAALRWLERRPPDLEEVRQALIRIARDGYRAGEVVSRIRDQVKKGPSRKEGLEIDEAILEVIELTRGEAAKNEITVRTEFLADLPVIQGDRVQLQQVILNLIVNAVEAMSGTSSGPRELKISTRKSDSKDVLVTVQDTGPGLVPAASDHLFDPFYTTKPNGLGLGLSICHSIIEEHGGRLWATETVPHGASFNFTLPAHRDKVP
ncbi:MAG TPA: PAS domain S-box protein [Pseudolabrys sp.]